MLDYEISVAEAATLFRENKACLLDVREPWEVQTAQIEGSLLMPLNDVPARAALELDPNHRLLVLCHHGMRSLSATAWLRRRGFPHAQSVRGGIETWSLEIDSTISRY